MSLSDLAAAGSFVSGLAVVISLIFVGLQMRQANRNQRSSMQQQRSAQNFELMLRLTDPAVQPSIMRGRAGDLTMEPPLVDAFIRAWIATFTLWENGFLQHKAGMIEAEVMASEAATHRVFLSYLGCRAAWKTVRGQFTGDFRDYLDGVVHDTAPARAPDLSARWKAFVADEEAALAEAVAHR